MSDSTPRPRRIQRKRTRDWRMPPGTRCVNRASRWGNPFYLWPKFYPGCVLGQPWASLASGPAMPTYTSAYMCNDVVYVTCSDHGAAVTHAVDLFRNWCEVRQRDIPARFAEWLAPLHGKNLACYCAVDAPCHADVLLELANS